MAAISQLLHTLRQARIADDGEYVMDRGQVNALAQLETGTMVLTHFTAVETETILSLQTYVEGSGNVSGTTTHCWHGVVEWDGTDYIPLAASVDDTSRWHSEGTYDTAVFAWDHAGEAGFEGFQKVAGRDYAEWRLWIGSGSGPQLWGSTGCATDALIVPRSNAILTAQTQPPAAPISGAFANADGRRFQTLMKR